MRLPRWLVISMFTSSVLAVLAAAGWWWVTWPERTARALLAMIADGQFEEVEQDFPPLQPLIDTKRFTPENRKHIVGSFSAPSFGIEEFPPRTIVDLVLCRRRFLLSPNAIALREIEIKRDTLVAIKRGFPPDLRRKN